MKVLVEFDLTNSIHRDLYNRVKDTMLAHDRVEVKLSTQPPVNPTTREDLMEAYNKAAEVSKDTASEALAKLQAKYGKQLSSWTPEVMWMAHQQFVKLAEDPSVNWVL